MAQLLVPIPDSQARLGGIGRTTIWKLVKQGDLEQVHIGKRAFITAESLEAYVGRLREAV
jgi:predicted DNA-binding transcriptional regulator AlpA